MKHFLFAVALVGASSSIAAADTWVTDDDYLGPQHDATAAHAVSDGTYLYVTGSDQGANGTRAVTRRRLLSTAGWHTIDTYVGDGEASASAIAYDATNGLLYTAGQTDAGPSSSRWWVRRSKDQGQNWDTIHIGTYFTGGQNSVGAMRVNGAGDVLVAITAGDSSQVYHWILKSSGNNWSTPLDVVDPVVTTSGGVAQPAAIGFDSSGYAIVTGTVIDSHGINGITRHNTSNGWVTMDTAPKRYNTAIAQITGEIYIGSEQQLGYEWITRRGPLAGPFTDVDTYGGAPTLSWGTGFQLFGGVLYQSGSDTEQWGVRESTDGLAWTSSERYEPNANGATEGAAYDIITAGGKLWAVGYSYDGTTSEEHWLVRVKQ
jgi:hypothetical protein|nr:hypothetical protein [Kofleriaceae bacterium]